MRSWANRRGQVYSRARNLGESETAEKIDRCVPKAGGEINNVNYSNQDEKGACGDGRVYAFSSLVCTALCIQIFIQFASPLLDYAWLMHI